MSNLKTYTVDDIRWQGPCYDPVTGRDTNGRERKTSGLLPPDWTGTAIDILNVKDCPPGDRLWVVCGLLSASEQRLLACAFVRYTPLADGRVVWDLLTDERSRTAVEVAERYARGEATYAEVNDAGINARAVESAAWEVYRRTVAAADRAAAWAADAAAAAALDLSRYVRYSAEAVSLADGGFAFNVRAAQIEIVRAFLLQEDSHA